MDNDSQRDLSAMIGQSFTGNLQHVLHKGLKASVEHYFPRQIFRYCSRLKER